MILLIERLRVVGKGIEPLCQDWESCILTVRWTDQLVNVAKLVWATERGEEEQSSTDQLAHFWSQAEAGGFEPPVR